MVELLEQITLERHLSLILGKRIHFRNSEISQLNPAMLKKTFFRLSHQYHPDKAALLGLDETYLTERFKNIQHAYTSVLDALNSGKIAQIVDRVSYTNQAERAQQAQRTHTSQQKSQTHTNRQPSEHFKKANSTTVYPRVFHTGSIPPNRHRLAQYLYYIKKIDRITLIKALSWQYSMRPRVGEIAMKAGYMSQNEVLSVIRSQKHESPFCTTAVSLGYITPYQRILIMGEQKLLKLPIGKFFLENGILSKEELNQALASLQQHNIRFR